MLTPLSPAARDQYTVVRATLHPVAELATVFLARPLDPANGCTQWCKGVLLIARKVPDFALYVTIVWHDWYASNRNILVGGHDPDAEPS